jgi:hypothetical protein
MTSSPHLFHPQRHRPRPFLGPSSRFTHPSNPRPLVGLIGSASSTDSEFGAFVFIPMSKDPVAQPSSSTTPLRVPSSGRHLGSSAGFFAEVQAATARNQQGLLTDAGTSTYAIPSGSTTTQPPATTTGPRLGSSDTRHASRASQVGC